ncbi:hypothetical protein [Adhaeribacter aquaticus]|uniref:hypothetical protein n=1 Tax=Adhaeribacter aquaticus TaxID=299567 RepID=UPI00047C8FB1|nr:hypothetical protein [Adhaeribacter aquaticus]
MKIIQPAEIAGKIMTLIDLSDQHVILVSPYNNISKWPKLTNRIEKALSRNVSVIWYVRENEGNKKEVEALGVSCYEIPRLHCKLYLNETSAIITSMNLNIASDTGSLDIGFETETIQEYKEILTFVEKFIKPWESKTVDHRLLNWGTFEELVISYIITKGLQKISDIQTTTKVILILYKKYYEIAIELNERPRLILNIKGDHKLREQKYLELKVIKSKIENEIGFEIDYGNQMKRLKFSLYNRNSNQPENFDKKDAILKIDKIVNTLNKHIDIS